MDNNLSIESELTRWISDVFKRLYPDVDFSDVNLQVTATSDERFGDYQCNAAMPMAKKVHKAPRAIAEEIQSQSAPDCVDKIEIAGPGFINFHLARKWLCSSLEALLDNERLGVAQPGCGKTVVLDYSAPNIAKPMHIGHIRSTVIGNALDRMHRFLGYRVISDNHVGDWGTQFGLMILGYRNFVDAEALLESPIEELERIYRESYARSQEDESWLAEARNELVKLQQGDEENRRLWQQFIDLSKDEFNKIYSRLDIHFDEERGESYYNEALPGVIDALESKGLVRESDGALVVDLEAEKLGVSIVRKSDGGYNYTTTDLATAISRAEEFNPEQIIYVTDERQQLHFKQFFTILKKLGYGVHCKHVWFGLMRLPDATFSTRQGNVIKLEALLDEAERRAFEIIDSPDSALDETQKKEVARAVGIGAVKYADLSQNPQSMVTFTWDKAMSLEGNSAPYLQYAYARIASVRDKYAERFDGKDYAAYPLLINEAVERRLAIHLLRFGDAVAGAARNYRPNYLADYLYELAQIYSTFYQNVPFLKAEEGLRESRVKLCDLVARTLRQGLQLLGIETPNRI